MLPPNEKKKICKNPVEIPTLWKNPVERERERERERVRGGGVDFFEDMCFCLTRVSEPF